MTTWADLFTPRQLVALTTFSDLVAEAMERVERDAANADLPNDERPLRDGGAGATAYAEAVGVYLGVCIESKLNTGINNRCAAGILSVRRETCATFARQAFRWFGTFAEGNPAQGSLAS